MGNHGTQRRMAHRRLVPFQGKAAAGLILFTSAKCPFPSAGFWTTYEAASLKTRNLLIAVSEGIRDENGTYLSEQTPGNRPDRFGHRDIAGTGGVLAQIVRNELGCKTRSLELNLMQRCAAHLASRTDLSESPASGCKGGSVRQSGTDRKNGNLLRRPQRAVTGFSLPPRTCLWWPTVKGPPPVD